ncbi:hypothetical protein [Micromonospora sp. NPDC002717]|uniref:hypothetical protein n=1 Tax=Micromonospora sp. NPDC002717 TaxID=3154424 RepID=UPI00331C01C2
MAALALVPISGAAAAAGPNLDFESGTLAPWTVAGGTWSVAQPGHQGQWAALMVDDSLIASASLRSAALPATAGSYEVGGWLSVAEGTPSLFVYFYDAAGRQLGTESERLRGLTAGWTWRSFRATAPAGTASARVMLYSSSADVTTARWDSISLERANWTETPLGSPLKAINLIGATIGTGADGRSETWTVSNGNPAVLQVIDTLTGDLESTLPLPGAGGSWSLVQHSSGDVYVATWPGGLLYRYRPGTGTVENLGRGAGAGTYLWDIEESSDGRLWFGSSPAGALTSYDPASGQYEDHGPMAPGQGYARSVAVAGTKVYVGMGSTQPQLVEYDAATRTKRSIPVPAEVANREFAYSLDFRGGLLYTRIQGVAGSDLYSYDVRTARWQKVHGVGVTAISPKRGTKIYFPAEGRLHSYNPLVGKAKDLGVGASTAVRTLGWVDLERPDMPGESVVWLDGRGGYLAWNPESDKSVEWQSRAMPVPVQLHAIETGPGNQLYVSGFIHPGLAQCDPRTLACTQLPEGGVGQIEGMFTDGPDLYLGSYGHAQLFRYDTTAPWTAATNPRLLANLSEQHFQDRPFGWAKSGGLIWTTTVPVYGHLGGVVASIDPRTDAVTVYDTVLGRRSGTSMTATGEDLVIGTSIWGGGGATPVETEASVIRWSPDGARKVWETTFPGQQAITAVKAGPDGHVWALSIDTLYRLDPTSGAILESYRLGTWQWANSAAWVHGHLEFGADGRLYILTLRHLWSLDTGSRTVRDLASGVTSFDFAVAEGSLFFFRGDQMYRLSNA